MKALLRFVLTLFAKIISAVIYFVGAAAIGIVVAIGLMVSFSEGALDLFAVIDHEEETADHYMLNISTIGQADRSGEKFLRSLFDGDQLPSTMFEMERAIAYAKDDDKILGIYADFHLLQLSPYEADRLSAAIMDFRLSGKQTVAFYAGSGENSFFEAAAMSAFEHRIIDEVSHFTLGGVAIERLYFKDLLDKFHLKWEIAQRHQYKTAFNPFLYNGPTAEEIETDSILLNELYAHTIKLIKQNSALSHDSIMAAIGNGAMDAQMATLEHGFFTEAISMVDLHDFMDKLVGYDDYLFYDLYDYANDLQALPAKNGSLIAFVLPLQGTIGGDADQIIEADTVSRAFEELSFLADEGDVDVIILTINSPGGDFYNSDLIYRTIQQFKEEWPDIPIIAQFQDVAASGGYYIGLPADHIVAGELSISGSIGVLGGKVVVGELAEEYGVNIAQQQRGAYANMWSPLRSFTDVQRAKLESMMDDTYARFTQVVIDNRALQKPIDELARGRISLGSYAKKNGMIDDIGGYDQVLKAVYDVTGSGVDKPIVFVYHSFEREPIDLVFDMLDSLPIITKINPMDILLDQSGFGDELRPFIEAPGIYLQSAPMRISG